MDNHLEILEETLRLRHLAPTAPDTLGESASRGSNKDLPRLVWIIHAVPSCLYQVVTRFTKKTRSSWRNVPTSTSAATPPPLDPSSLKVSVLTCQPAYELKAVRGGRPGASPALRTGPQKCSRASFFEM